MRNLKEINKMERILNKRKLFGIAIGAVTVIAVLVSGCGGYDVTATTPVGNTSTLKTTSATTSITTNSTFSGVQGTMSISIANKNVKAGDSFTIDVFVDTKLTVRGGQSGISFDPLLMKCDEVTEGSYLKDWAKTNGIDTMIMPQPKIDNVNGKVSVMGISLFGMAIGGPTGKGLLLTYHFTALKDGVISPKLTDALLAIPSNSDRGPDMLDLTGDNLRVVN
jgi:hypothetical protein